jgi:hypothetical protein
MDRGSNLMDAKTLLENYQAVRAAMPQAKLPTLETATYSLKLESKTLDSLAEVYAEMDHLAPVAGWIGYQSGNQHFNKQPLAIKTDYGVLLNAEMTNGHGASLHVRNNGRGGWIVTHYHYKAGSEYLADRVEHIASHDALGKVKYLRFWQQTENGLGLNPVFACFTSFGG